MEHDHAATTSAAQGETIELRVGRVWELTTTSGERVAVDRGFRPEPLEAR